MQREYIDYVKETCKSGMSPEEVQYLFNDIYSKSNTKQGKRVLRLFARGIGKAKKNVLINQANMVQNYQTPVKSQEMGYQYQYFKQ